MKFKYTTKEKIFETDVYEDIPWGKLHSINDNPAYEDLKFGIKNWYFEGKLHRETGPASIVPGKLEYFYLNGKYYKNVNDWLWDHPNKDENFQKEMREKYSY